MRARGEDIISFAAGEPDFATPDFICQAAIDAIRDGETHYTSVDGMPALREAAAVKFARDNGLEYSSDEIIVGSGAKQHCYNICLAVLGPGDEAIVPAPYWVSYPEMVRLADASPVIVAAPAGQDYKLKAPDLEAALTPATRLLFINTPSNPTGATYSRSELAALGEVLEAWPRVVIASDEIYEHIYWGDEPFTSFARACPALRERTLTINGVSKGFAMTGWRIGIAAGPATLIRAMRTLQGQSTTNACTISQFAALAALSADPAFVAPMRDEYRARHDIVYRRLAELDGVTLRPATGAFYAFADIVRIIARRALADDVEFCEQLLTSKGLAVVPGTAFGAPGHVRLSFACDRDTLAAGLDRFCDFCLQ